MARGRPTRPRLRSKTATRRPPRARSFAVINPIGPAPTITTSYSLTNSAPTLDSCGISRFLRTNSSVRLQDSYCAYRSIRLRRQYEKIVFPKGSEIGQNRLETAGGDRPPAARQEPRADRRGRSLPLHELANCLGYDRRRDEAGASRERHVLFSLSESR